MKKRISLAYELKSCDVDSFISNISSYKISDYIIFDVDLTEEDRKKIDSFCSCEYIKCCGGRERKFLLFNLLDSYSTIIFTNIHVKLDDIFFKKYLDSSFAIICCNNTRFVEYYFDKFPKGYKMFLPAHDISVMVISDKLKMYKKISKFCFYMNIRYNKMMRNSFSAIIELVIQKFKLNVQPIIFDNVEKTDLYELPCGCINKNSKHGELVSVLMSVYNRTEFLDDAVKSILNQTYKNLELVVVVEFSDKQDVVNKILKKYNDDRIVIINNEKKLGFADSLNLGLSKCRGRYIARMDDDDVSCLDRIEKQVDYLSKNQNVAILGSYMQFFCNSDLVCELPCDYESLKVKCLYKTPLFHPTVMFNMNILNFEDLKYRSNIFAEDYDLWSRLIGKYTISNIPQVLYYYRLNGGNNSVSDEESMNHSHLEIMKFQLKSFLKISLGFDDLQILSGRIDVLCNSYNFEKVFNRKKFLWNLIKKKNKKYKFYDDKFIDREIEEVNDLYKLLCTRNNF